MTIHRSLLLAATLLVAASFQFAAAAPAAADGHSWERFAERHDLDGDGTVTREEIAKSSSLFDHLDADADGALTAEDFAARRGERILGHVARVADADDDGALTRAELDAWFAERDTNGDGELSAADREGKAREHRRRGMRHGGPSPDGEQALTRAELDSLFAARDANGDGTLAGDEIPDPRGMWGHHRAGGHHARRGPGHHGN